MLVHLKTQLFNKLIVKLHQDIVEEIEKSNRDRDKLDEVLAECKEQMLQLVMDKVHYEVKWEIEM